MANTYTQIFVHVVFAVKFRDRLLTRPHREELQKYITGIVQNNGHKMLAIKCMSDHMHLLVGLKPYQALSDLVRDIKASSSALVNERKWFPGKFQWQTGFGGFSCSKSEVDAVIHYIDHQEEHHRTKRFHDEYVELLKAAFIEFDERYLFRWDDDNVDQESE